MISVAKTCRWWLVWALCLVSPALVCVALAKSPSKGTSKGECAAASDREFRLSARDFVKKILVGWNLGNTLEAHPDPKKPRQKNLDPSDTETLWWNPITTEAMFEKVAKTGFNAVRIPITWDPHTQFDARTNKVTISRPWLNRVKEVVEYALRNDLIVIINMHHDDKLWLDISKSGEDWESVTQQYRQMWAIIAEEFKDYGENLLFEAANEIIAGSDWWGNDAVFFERQNELYQIFHKTVRDSGGNNPKRYLVFPTYGAQWYPHQYQKIWLPDADSRSICDIHWYSSDINPDTFDGAFQKMARYFETKNVGLILGECGLQKSNVQIAQEWAPAYIGTARKYGIPCFLWDDGGNFQILLRKECEWKNPFYLKAVLDAASGKTMPGKKTIDAEIQYQNWYCNGGAATIREDGAALVTSGDGFVRQVQPCFHLPPASVVAVKKLANASKDGFVYIDFVGSFDTGANEKKLFIKGGFKEGGGWNIGKDWEFTLVSGSRVSVPFPVAQILESERLSLTIQLNNYTFGHGIRNLRMTISPPYVR
ncbi:MAG: glycoside hydrolase family 5 protein [Planctomycetia bacterium]|nr:glycoside hydrolase family 5 protein [Planctomycetia bacterium]